MLTKIATKVGELRWPASSFLACGAAAIGLSLLTLRPGQSAAQPPENSADSKPANKVSAESDAKSEPTLGRVANTVAGQVMDTNNQPILGVQVSLFRLTLDNGRQKLIGETSTDATGRYQFDSVIDIDQEFPGRRFPPPHEPGDQILQCFLRSPGRTTITWNAPRQAIAQHGVFHQFSMQSAATLTGLVTGQDGKPVAGAIVSIDYGSLGRWEGAYTSRTDVDGFYRVDDAPEIDLEKHSEQVAELQRIIGDGAGAGGGDNKLFITPPPGLTVQHPDFALLHTRLEKVPGKKDITLELPAIFEGRVVFADSGQPAVGATVTVYSSVDPAASVVDMPMTFRGSKITASDGSFRIKGLPSGKFDVLAERRDQVCASVFAIVASSGKTTQVPDLKFGQGGGISARIIDATTGEPVALTDKTHATIVAELLPRRLGRPYPASAEPANSQGRFLIFPLLGKYAVTVSLIDTPGGKKWIGQKPLEVDVAEGQTTNVDLEVVEFDSATDRNAVASLQATRRFDFKQAIRQRSAILEKEPDNVNALMERAEFYSRLRDDENTLADYERLVKLVLSSSQKLTTYNNIAFLLAVSPNDKLRDGKRAVEFAEKAKQFVQSPNVDVLDTLAAAYAEAGDYERAVKTQQEAIELAPEQLRGEYRKYLELYESRKPRREMPPAANQPANGDLPDSDRPAAKG